MARAAHLKLREGGEFSRLENFRRRRTTRLGRADVLEAGAVTAFAADADVTARRSRIRFVVGGSVASEAVADLRNRSNTPQAFGRRQRMVLRIARREIESIEGGVPAQAALHELACREPSNGRDPFDAAPER